jgi:hypothetical protein
VSDEDWLQDPAVDLGDLTEVEAFRMRGALFGESSIPVSWSSFTGESREADVGGEAGFLGSFTAVVGSLGGFTADDDWLGSFTSVDGLRGFGGRCSEGVLLNFGGDAAIT